MSPAETTTDERAALEVDLRAGLWSDPPSLPARWFYDERGSALFEEITRLPEYYPTRAERAILRDRSDSIVAATGASSLHELGAGSARKTRMLLDALTRGDRPGLYAPLDISAGTTSSAAARLRREYPSLVVEPSVADFTGDLPALSGEPGRRLLAFLGGTIGNFTETERAGFLGRARAALSADDHLLLGADLVKDPARLVAAYDDAAGVTADFNLNVLDVVARTADAQGLRREDFVHVARWVPEASRIEMRLRAVRDVEVRFPGIDRLWRLAEGGELLTEISRKFTVAEIEDELTGAGFLPVATWTGRSGDVALTLARVV